MALYAHSHTAVALLLWHFQHPHFVQNICIYSIAPRLIFPFIKRHFIYQNGTFLYVTLSFLEEGKDSNMLEREQRVHSCNLCIPLVKCLHRTKETEQNLCEWEPCLWIKLVTYCPISRADMASAILSLSWGQDITSNKQTMTPFRVLTWTLRMYSSTALSYLQAWYLIFWKKFSGASPLSLQDSRVHNGIWISEPALKSPMQMLHWGSVFFFF